MPWRMTNVTIMDPQSLAAQIDNNTDRLFGGHKRKYNPYPRMRIKEQDAGRQQGRKSKASQPPAPQPLPDRGYITPNFLYALDLIARDPEDVARKILRKCDRVRVLFPAFGDEPALPGYLVLAFDHEITEAEATLIHQALSNESKTAKDGCRLLPGAMSDEERDRVLGWIESERGA